MKTAMKKLFSLLLVAVLLVGVMPFQAFAVEPDLKTAAGRVYVNNEVYDFDTLIDEGTYSAEQILARFYGGNVESFVIKTPYGEYGPNTAEIWVPGNSYLYVYITPAAPAHEHEYVGEVTTEPTCTQDGVKTFTCSCGEGTYTEPVNKLGHNYENGKCTRCGICEDCGKAPCACTATVEIRIHISGTEGNTEGKQFKMPIGVKTAQEICAAANYTDNHILSFSVTDGNGANKIVREETMELVAGGFYYLWLEIPAAETEPTPEYCKCGKVLDNGMCPGCYLDAADCNCNETTKPDNQKHGAKLILDYNYRGAKDTVMNVEHGAKLIDVIAGIPAPNRDGHLFSHWTLDAEGKETIGRDDRIGKKGITIYAQWDDDLAIGGDLTVRVNLNYDRKMGDSLKNIVKGTKMGDVLDYVNTPYRWGYKFVGWYWDAKGKNDVEWHDEVLKDCEIYAKWERVSNETMLKIYINGDTQNVAKIVDLHDYAKDGWISKDEVKTVVKQYYTAKDSDGLTFYGLFDGENWKSFIRNKNHDGSKHIEVNKGYDTTVYVMVHNAKAYASSSSTADSSNPKTGDTIGMAITMMAVSAAALAAVYVTSKKRAV